MPTGSGLDAQIGFATESTFGTFATPTRFVPVVSEGLEKKIERIESKGIIAGARVLRSQQWAPGRIDPMGPINLEMYDRSIGLLLRYMFGAVATAGSGPFTHTFTPGDLGDDSFTYQAGRPDINGTVRPFSYLGCMVAAWEIAVAEGENGTLGLDVVAQDESTAQTLAAVSYSAGIKPMNYIGGSVTVAGSATNVTKATLAGDTGLNKNRRFLSSALRSQPKEAALRPHTGTLEAEFENLTAYNRFVNATEASLVFTLASGAQTLVITTNVRFDGKTPNVEGTDITKLSLPFKAIGPTTDAGAITAVFTTSEATP